MEEWIGQTFASLPGEVSADPLLRVAYFAKHPHRLDYASRLASGRSIGSGLVEGSIKQWVNLRRKRTGARWCAEGVGPWGELIALVDTPDSHHFWTAAWINGQNLQAHPIARWEGQRGKNRAN